MNENIEQVTAERSKRSRFTRVIMAAAGVAASICICAFSAALVKNGSDIAAADSIAAKSTEATDITASETVTEKSETQPSVIGHDVDSTENVPEKYAGCLRLTVSADGEDIEVFAKPGSTVGEALEMAGVVLGEGDSVDVDTKSKIFNGSVVTVERAERVTEVLTRFVKKNAPDEEDAEADGEDETEAADAEALAEALDEEAENSDEPDTSDEADTSDEVEASDEPETTENEEEADEEQPSYEETDEDNETPEDADASYEEDAEEDDDTDVTETSEEEEDEAEKEPSLFEMAAREAAEMAAAEHDEEEPSEPEETENAVADEKVFTLDGSVPVSNFENPDWLKLDENGVPTEYISTVCGRSCAYTAKPDALMSTGKTVFQGYVAVDPKVIPYGSELYIIADDGALYGYAIAADTGSSVRKGSIVVDLFMNEYDDCIQWGSRNVTIYVLR